MDKDDLPVIYEEECESNTSSSNKTSVAAITISISNVRTLLSDQKFKVPSTTENLELTTEEDCLQNDDEMVEIDIAEADTSCTSTTAEYDEMMPVIISCESKVSIDNSIASDRTSDKTQIASFLSIEDQYNKYVETLSDNLSNQKEKAAKAQVFADHLMNSREAPILNKSRIEISGKGDGSEYRKRNCELNLSSAVLPDLACVKDSPGNPIQLVTISSKIFETPHKEFTEAPTSPMNDGTLSTEKILLNKRKRNLNDEMSNLSKKTKTIGTDERNEVNTDELLTNVDWDLDDSDEEENENNVSSDTIESHAKCHLEKQCLSNEIKSLRAKVDRLMQRQMILEDFAMVEFPNKFRSFFNAREKLLELAKKRVLSNPAHVIAPGSSYLINILRFINDQAAGSAEELSLTDADIEKIESEFRNRNTPESTEQENESNNVSISPAEPLSVASNTLEIKQSSSNWNPPVPIIIPDKFTLKSQQIENGFCTGKTGGVMVNPFYHTQERLTNQVDKAPPIPAPNFKNVLFQTNNNLNMKKKKIKQAKWTSVEHPKQSKELKIKECCVCSIKMPWKILRAHINVHLGVIFPCPLCKAQFFSIGAVRGCLSQHGMPEYKNAQVIPCLKNKDGSLEVITFKRISQLRKELAERETRKRSEDILSVVPIYRPESEPEPESEPQNLSFCPNANYSSNPTDNNNASIQRHQLKKNNKTLEELSIQLQQNRQTLNELSIQRKQMMLEHVKRQQQSQEETLRSQKMIQQQHSLQRQQHRVERSLRDEPRIEEESLRREQNIPDKRMIQQTHVQYSSVVNKDFMVNQSRMFDHENSIIKRQQAIQQSNFDRRRLIEQEEDNRYTFTQDRDRVEFYQSAPDPRLIKDTLNSMQRDNKWGSLVANTIDEENRQADLRNLIKEKTAERQHQQQRPISESNKVLIRRKSPPQPPVISLLEYQQRQPSEINLPGPSSAAFTPSASLMFQNPLIQRAQLGSFSRNSSSSAESSASSGQSSYSHSKKFQKKKLSQRKKFKQRFPGPADEDSRRRSYTSNNNTYSQYASKYPPNDYNY